MNQGEPSGGALENQAQAGGKKKGSSLQRMGVGKPLPPQLAARAELDS